MITIIVLTIISFIIYLLLNYNENSIMEKPNIAQITFFRDYLVFTMLSYMYVLHDNLYKHHYILSKISSSDIIVQAAVQAFIFIVIFMISFKILYIHMKGSIKKISNKINERKLLFFISLFSFFLSIYFIVVTIYYNASIFGLLKYNAIELVYKRAELSQGTGMLQFHKFIIKSWIPLTSYLLYYLYLKESFYKTRHYILFYWMIFLSILAAIWYFEKSVIVFYFLGLVGVYVYSGKKYRKKSFLLFFLFIFFLISIAYLAIYQNRIVDAQYLIDIILHRATGQADGSIVAVDYFNEHNSFGISGISHVLADISGKKFQTPYGFLIDYYDPATADTSGSISSFAVGEAYGLFGYIGVLLSGIIIAMYYAFFEASKYSQFTAIMFVPIYGEYFAHPYVAGVFYIFLWPINLVIVLMPYILIAILSIQKRKLIYENFNTIRCK